MAEPLPYRILTPDGVAAEGEASMVVIPGVDGDLGVLLRHSPMIIKLRRGSVAVFADGQKVSQRFYVDGGTAHISPESLMILSDSVTDVEALDATVLAQHNAESGSDDALKASAQLEAIKSPVYG